MNNQLRMQFALSNHTDIDAQTEAWRGGVGGYDIAYYDGFKVTSTTTTFSPTVVLKTTFDDNDTTKNSWTQTGNHTNGSNTSGIYTSGLYRIYSGSATDPAALQYNMTVVPGATYNFSVDTQRSGLFVLKAIYNGTTNVVAEGSSADAGEWSNKTVEGTFTVPDGVTSVTLQVGLNAAVGSAPNIDTITLTQQTAGSGGGNSTTTTTTDLKFSDAAFFLIKNESSSVPYTTFNSNIMNNLEKVVIHTTDNNSYIVNNSNYTDTEYVSNHKYFPILTKADSNGYINTVLQPDELSKAFAGKKVTAVKVVTREHNTSAILSPATYLEHTGEKKENGSYFNYLDSSQKPLGQSVYWNGSTKVYETGTPIELVYAPGENGEVIGYRVDLRVSSQTRVDQIIVRFDDDSTYTIDNTNFKQYQEIKKEHSTGFTNDTNLLNTSGTQYQSQYLHLDDESYLSTNYWDKNLNYIVVDYGSNIKSPPQNQIVIDYQFRDPNNNNNLTTTSMTLTNGEAMGSGKFRYNCTATAYGVDALKIIDGSDDYSLENIKSVTMSFDDGASTYTIKNSNYQEYVSPDGPHNLSHETSFTGAAGNNLLTTSGTKYNSVYQTKYLDDIIVYYGEDSFLSIPRDRISINNGNTGNTPKKNSESSMIHTYAPGTTSITDLRIIEGILGESEGEIIDDGFTLEDISKIVMSFDNGESSYTIINSDYSPKVEAKPPVSGKDPVLGSEYVYVSQLELTESNNWQAALDGLPVTDGQGNMYEYVIVEKSIYGSGADRYQLVSYEHPDGLPLDDEQNNDLINTSFLNSNIDDENGPIIMPSTGGEGRTWFYVGGIALMLCGIAGCYGMKRWQKSRR